MKKITMLCLLQSVRKFGALIHIWIECAKMCAKMCQLLEFEDTISVDTCYHNQP